MLLYMGLRPIHGVFVDMQTYAYIFERYKDGESGMSAQDPLFSSYMMFSSKIMSAQSFFLLSTLLYVVPLYIISKKWFQAYWFYAFLFLVGSFSFWAYGVNGIRNGIAGSIFLLGVSRDRRIFQALWILIAIGFHYSLLLPTIGFLLANIYNQPKRFIIFWIICIPISLIANRYWNSFFAGLSFISDERFGNYLTDTSYMGSFRRTGFRWDFLLYSSTAVLAGWYYIIKKQYKDKLYFYLFNTYLFANAFWILVIRASFSNRFAYLSWFMMAIIIVYPLLKERIFFNQHKKLGLILLFYFGFTFIMGVVI